MRSGAQSCSHTKLIRVLSGLPLDSPPTGYPGVGLTQFLKLIVFLEQRCKPVLTSDVMQGVYL